MTDLWPGCATEQDFAAVRRDDARLYPGVRAICAALGHGHANVERFPDGSLPVYAIGDDLVLKLYPPLFADEHHTEAAVLSAVAGRLAVPTPAVLANGALSGWGYLLMTRLRGRPLTAAWSDIHGSGQAALARALGVALAALHALPAPRCEAVRIDWHAFVDTQRRTALARQRARGLDEMWLRQIPDFLASVSLDGAAPAALLHTEVMREHLLVTRRDDEWRLSGLFDFEPAVRGAPEYEFASVGLFFACGDSHLLRQVLLAYGYAPEQLNRELSRRLLAYALLHRYSNLPWYLWRLPVGRAVTSLDDLATCWFATDAPDRRD